MFLGLAVFFILAFVAYVAVLRAVKALFRLLTGKRKMPEPENARREKKKENKVKEESRSESRTKSEQEEIEKEPDPEKEQIRLRHDAALSTGITESFSSDGSGFTLDPKVMADRCTEQSGLSYLEFNNRELAGDDYFGFNLIIEKDSRMVLTYNGQAVASLTKVEVKSTATINGREVEGTAPAWRINTFPPSLSPGIVPSDLGKMLSAADRVRECGRDTALAADRMLAAFSDPENVIRLRKAIDRKIQTKESAKKDTARQQRRKSPARLDGGS